MGLKNHFFQEAFCGFLRSFFPKKLLKRGYGAEPRLFIKYINKIGNYALVIAAQA